MLNKNVLMIRRILPVGQGAFYLERFYNHAGQPCFTIVYDCGAYPVKRYVKREIERNFKQGEIVNIVFISHLDADHLNGLMDLLKRCQVKCIVYPLLEDWEYQISWVVNKILSKDEFVEAFITDAKEAIGKLDLSYEPILVKVKKREGEGHENNGNVVIEGEESLIEQGEIESGSRILLDMLNMHGQMQGARKWIFSPFNFQHDLRKQELVKHLAVEFGDSFDIKGLRSYWEKSYENRRKIKCAYEKLKGETNANSMILYSGPQRSTDKQVLGMCTCAAVNQCRWWIQFLRAGCLYTGDYCAAATENWRALDLWCRPFWDDIGCVQIPHHGSILSFNKNLIREHAVHFVSVGDSNNHGHPSGEVCASLMAAGKCLCMVTESLTSELDFRVCLV